MILTKPTILWAATLVRPRGGGESRAFEYRYETWEELERAWSAHELGPGEMLLVSVVPPLVGAVLEIVTGAAP